MDNPSKFLTEDLAAQSVFVGKKAATGAFLFLKQEISPTGIVKRSFHDLHPVEPIHFMRVTTLEFMDDNEVLIEEDDEPIDVPKKAKKKVAKKKAAKKKVAKKKVAKAKTDPGPPSLTSEEISSSLG